jgi:hypothetical protein
MCHIETRNQIYSAEARFLTEFSPHCSIGKGNCSMLAPVIASPNYLPKQSLSASASGRPTAI